jgi:hypothetical protein
VVADQGQDDHGDDGEDGQADGRTAVGTLSDGRAGVGILSESVGGDVGDVNESAATTAREDAGDEAASLGPRATAPAQDGDPTQQPHDAGTHGRFLPLSQAFEWR